MSAPARFVHSGEVLARARAVEWVRFTEGRRIVSVRFASNGIPTCLTCLTSDCRHVEAAKRERAKGKGAQGPKALGRMDRRSPGTPKAPDSTPRVSRVRSTERTWDDDTLPF
jgi:hypothetical protein